MTDDDSKASEASLISHLEELRWRLVRCAVAVVIGFGVSYAFKERLFEVLTRPLIEAMKGTQNTMIFTGLPEAFFTYLKVSLLAGIILALPVIFYQFWMFVAPGLYKRERRIILPVVLISLVFFAAGASFGYFLVFPYGFKFFLGFSSEAVRAYPSMKEYLTFASKLLLAFGLAFELPLIITCFARFGMVSVDFLKKNRKYAILIFFTGSAVLTPPDVVTQVMLSIPLMILYELSIWGAKLFGRKPLDADPTEDDSATEESTEKAAAEHDHSTKAARPKSISQKFWIIVRFILFGCTGLFILLFGSIDILALYLTHDSVFGPLISLGLVGIGALMMLYGVGKWRRWGYLLVFLSIPVSFFLSLKIPINDKGIPVFVVGVVAYITYIGVFTYYARSQKEKE